MKNMKKTLVMVVSLALVAMLAIGGTLAYLTVDPIEKSNVFTVGDIDIELNEKYDGTKGAATPEEILDADGNMTGVKYNGVMPGDYLQKEVSVANTGKNPAYVAVEVTFDNALEINNAIDEVYEKRYSKDTPEVQAIYDYIFDGFGMNYTKTYGNGEKTDMRLTITGSDMPAGVMQVDSVKTIDQYVIAHNGNWFAEGDTIIKDGKFKGYYSEDMGTYELRYTYYMLLKPDESVTLFKGFNVPAAFNAEQLKMFEDMNIDIKASAIQADNFADAKAAFTALKEEYKDGVNDGDVGAPELQLVSTAEDLAKAFEVGGLIKLTDDITANETLSVPEGKTVILDLGGNTLSIAKEKNDGALIDNNGTLTVKGGTLENTTENGDAVINNNGTMVLDGTAVESAPIGTTGYPAYAIYTSGKLTVKEGTVISADRGAICMNNGADVVIDGGEISVSDALGTRVLTAHVIYAYGTNSKLTINDGEFAMDYKAGKNTGASVICPAGATIKVCGGNFTYAGEQGGQSGIFQNYMGYGAPVNVYGGTYNDTTVNKNLASGYKVTDNGNGTWTVGGAKADTNESLDDAIKNGETVIELPAGTFIIPDSAQGKTLTIIGNGDTVIAIQDDGSYEGCDYSLDGSTVTFENITINTDSRTYTGYARMKGIYNNCTINGAYTLYGESVFNNCTFNVTGDTYNIWTWGAKTAKFNGCTFNTDGKSILVYNQSCDVYIDNCIFNDRTNGTGFTKSALETGVDGVGPKYNIYINNTKFNGFAENDKCVGYKNIVGNKNSMTDAYLNIVIDGVDVY